MDVEPKALMGRLNAFCTRAFTTAAGVCMSRANYEVTVEHVVQVLLEDTKSDAAQILNHYEIDPNRVVRGVTKTIEGFKTGNSGRPVFSPILFDWLKQARL